MVNEFTKKEWKWAILTVMMRHEKKIWSKEEVSFEAKILLMEKYPDRLLPFGGNG